MPTIRPFTALRYDPQVAGPLARDLGRTDSRLLEVAPIRGVEDCAASPGAWANPTAPPNVTSTISSSTRRIDAPAHATG